MKKFVSLLITIILINISLPATANTLNFGAFEFCVYEKSVSITGFNSVNTKKLIIPSVINNLPVTAVNASADREGGVKNEAVEEIIFPEGVEFIGSLVSDAFPNLSSVTLPKTLKKIGDYAFYGTQLLKVDLPPALEDIGSFAFANTGITSLEIPEHVKSFNGSILYGNEGSGITVDKKNAFFIEEKGVIYNKEKTAVVLYSSNSKTLSLPKSVKEVLPCAFKDNSVLKEITLGESVTKIGESAFSGSKIKKAVIKGKITEIPPHLFYGCASLESVTLPETVAKINEGAFAACPSLASFSAKGDIKYIADSAFDKNTKAVFALSGAGMAPAYFNGFENAKSVLTSAPDGISIPRAAFSDADGGILVERFYGGQNAVGIPSYINNKPVKKIADWAFSGMNFESIKIDAPDIMIGYGAFCGSGVKSLEFADNLHKTKIGERAFEGTALEKIKLADAVCEIGERSFAGIPVAEVVIPAGVKTVGKEAFADCKNLVSVYFEGDAPSIADDAFLGSENVRIYYKKGATGFSNILPGVPKETCPRILRDGSPLALETLPVNIDGTVMLPLKEILSLYGYSVSWNAADGVNGSVTATKGNNTIKLFIGSTYGEHGGNAMHFTAAPRIINGCTRIPSRTIAYILGFKVVWNAAACAVEFNS